MYKLFTNNPETKYFYYDQDNNVLYNNKKEKLDVVNNAQCKCAKKYVLRLSFGKKCNFNCKYCVQTKDNYQPKFIGTEFVNKLHELVPDIENVQFWGGEPLVYFDQIKEIYSAFKSKYNNISFTICTNGKELANPKYRDFLSQQDVGIGVSHDGKGQVLRGEDILLNPDIVEFIRTKRAGFSPVATKENDDLKSCIDYIAEKIGYIPYIGQYQVLMVVDESSKNCVIPQDKLPEYSKRLLKLILSNEMPFFGELMDHFTHFVHMYDMPFRNDAKCFVSNPNVIVMDIEGNIIPCQTFDKLSTDAFGNSMLLGNVFDLNSIKDIKDPPLQQVQNRLDTRCKKCILKFVCHGMCPYTLPEYEDINCDISFHHFLPFFIHNIFRLTGDIVTSFEETDDIMTVSEK